MATKMTWADVSAALRAGAPPSELIPLARGLFEKAPTSPTQPADPNKKPGPLSRLYQKIPGSKETFQLVYLRPPLSLFERFGENEKMVFDGELDFDLLEGFQPWFIKEFEDSGDDGGMEEDKGEKWRLFGGGGGGDEELGRGERELVEMGERLGMEELVMLGREVWRNFVVPTVENQKKGNMERLEVARRLKRWQWGVIYCDWEKEFGQLSVEVNTQSVKVMNCHGLGDFVITGALPHIVFGIEELGGEKDGVRKGEFLSTNIKDLISVAFDVGSMKELDARAFKAEINKLNLSSILPVGPHVELFLYVKYAQALTT